MSHVETVPHECEGNLIYCEHGLSPYWALSKLCWQGFDGGTDKPIETTIDGDPWTIEFWGHRGGIAPRPTDDVGGDQLYEYRIKTRGPGEQKASYHLTPRFTDMRHFETGERISTPFDHIPEDEGINLGFQGSNLEPARYPQLFQQFVDVLARAGGTHINPDYFASEIHEMSNITTYERYVRINRTWSPKLVGHTGIMHRLLTLCAAERGSKVEYRIDNEEIVGKNHRVILGKQDAQRLISGHRYGKQIKHYHPKHVRTSDKGDPLYHPKVGVLLKKSLNGHAFKWTDRRSLRRELDETLVNLLYWSDVPIRADPTTYIADDHFEAKEAPKSVNLEADPTPEFEASQEALLVTTLRNLCDSDVEVLETLVTDGGQQHPEDLATRTERGISTIYRSLKRLQGVVRNENATVTFASKKIEQEIAGIVESTEHQIANAGDRIAKLYNLETRQAASSAWQKWCTKYAAKIEMADDDAQLTVRIDTLLSRFRSSSCPHLQNVLMEALEAWAAVGRDVQELRQAWVKWHDSNGALQVGVVGPTLR